MSKEPSPLQTSKEKTACTARESKPHRFGIASPGPSPDDFAIELKEDDQDFKPVALVYLITMLDAHRD
jgi:hypothetical protein